MLLLTKKPHFSGFFLEDDEIALKIVRLFGKYLWLLKAIFMAEHQGTHFRNISSS
jgi:hypothetical protein